MFFVAPRRIAFALTAAICACYGVNAVAQLKSPASGQPPQSQQGAPQLPPELKKISDQYFAAVKLHTEKKYPEAIVAYKQFVTMALAAKVSPEALAAAYTNLASIYQLQSDKPDYAAMLLKVVEYDPKNARAYAQLAIVAGTDHNFADAQKWANKTLALKPVAQMASSAHFVKGNVAVSHKDFQTAANEFHESARLMPNNNLAHFNYGLSLAELKHYDQALAELQVAIKLDPNNKNALEYYEKLKTYVAQIAQNQNKSAPAITNFDAILKKDPKNGIALLGRARVLAQMMRTSEAVSAYIDAIAVLPHSYEAQYELGNLYQQPQIGKFTNAITFFKKAADIAVAAKDNKKQAQALGAEANAELQEGSSLADYRQKVQMLSSAEAHERQAIELTPLDIDLKVRLGRIYNAESKFSDAESVYREILTLTPDNVTIYNLLSGTFQSRLDVPGFVKVWKQYQERRPDDPTSYQYIADIYNRTRDYKNAIIAINGLLGRKISNSVIAGARVILGQDQAELHQYESARAEFRKVLALTPSPVPAQYKMQENASLEAEQRKALKALAGLSGVEKKPDEAIGYLNDLKAREAAMTRPGTQPIEPDVYKDIAVLYEQSNRIDLAIKEFNTMAHAFPTNPTPFEELGRLYEAEKKFELAVENYRRASSFSVKDPIPNLMKIADLYRRNKMLDKAIEQLDSMHKKYANNIEVMTALAEVYQQASQDSKALDTYDAISKVNPNLNWVQDRRAAVFMRLKRYTEAQAIYIKELETSKSPSRQTYEDLFHAFTVDGHPEKSLPYVKPRLERNPASSTLIAVVYDEFVRQNHEAEGQAYIEAVIKTAKPFKRMAQEAYANVLQIHHHNDLCLKIYRDIATEYPKDLVAQTNLADQLDFNNQAAEANDVYTAQIARADLPKDQKSSLERRLAERYIRQNLLSKARDLYNAIYTAENRDFDAAMRLGALVEKTGTPDEAIAFYTKLLPSPTYPPIVMIDLHNRIGAIYEKQGKKTEALQQYRETLKIEPENSLATSGIHRLGG